MSRNYNTKDPLFERKISKKNIYDYLIKYGEFN